MNIDYMNKTAEEVKKLFPENAVTAAGNLFHDKINTKLDEHMAYYSHQKASILANDNFVQARFDKDMNSFRRLAERMNKEGWDYAEI